MDMLKFIKKEPAADPVDMYVKLMDRESAEWKNDEDRKKEFYRFKQEHEQMMCTIAAGVYEETKKSLM